MKTLKELFKDYDKNNKKTVRETFSEMDRKDIRTKREMFKDMENVVKRKNNLEERVGFKTDSFSNKI